MNEPKDWVARYRKEATGTAQEVLDRLFRGILDTPAFTLGNGMKAKIEPFFPPKRDEDGTLRCGIDVILENGTHLEFTVENTGWGKSMVADMLRPGDGPRGR